MIDRCKIL